MRALNNVERITPVPADVFEREYSRKQRPVIITNLFDDQPIRAASTQEAARELFGGTELVIQPNYMVGLLAATPPARRTATLAAYVDHVRTHPRTVDMCVEFDTPESIAKLYAPPIYCSLRDPLDVVSNTFVAGAGNFAHLHFDFDHRDVLLSEIFGVKRFILIDPRETPKVDPFLDPRVARTSALFLEHFSEDDKAAFVRYTNGFDTLLFPGETLFIPVMMWHYAEYLETSLSVNYRLGRRPVHKAFASATPAPSIYLQALSAQAAREPDSDEPFASLVDHIQRIRGDANLSPRERSIRLEQIFLEAYEALYPSTRPYTMQELVRRASVREPVAPS